MGQRPLAPPWPVVGRALESMRLELPEMFHVAEPREFLPDQPDGLLVPPEPVIARRHEFT